MAAHKVAIAAAGLAVAGLIGGGVSLAYADGTASTSPSASTSTAAAGTPSQSTGGQNGGQMPAALTGDQLAQVTAAVKTKDANATVQRAWTDTDGSGFDAVVTSGGKTIKYEVSTDLKTVTVDDQFGTGGHQFGTGGHGGRPGDGSSTGSGQSTTATQQG